MYGYFDTMSEGDKSAICIEDASTASPQGALCAEANITTSGATTVYGTNTWSIKAADVGTKLNVSAANMTAAAGRTMDFGGTTVTSPTATQVWESKNL